jgi:hypothetical protein
MTSSRNGRHTARIELATLIAGRNVEHDEITTASDLLHHAAMISL